METQARMPPAAKVDLTPENNLILPLRSLADMVNVILDYLPLKACGLRTLSPVSVMQSAVWTVEYSVCHCSVTDSVVPVQLGVAVM